MAAHTKGRGKKVKSGTASHGSWTWEIIVLLAVVVAVLLLKDLGLLYPLERFVIDVFAISVPTEAASRTAIIDIDDASYRDPTLFNATSPLNHALLARLLVAAATAGASAIVVDVDTDPGSVLKEVSGLVPDGKPLAVPIVWAAMSDPCNSESKTCLLPRTITPTTSPPLRAGLATLLTDGDGVVRRYMPEYPIGQRLENGGCTCTDKTGPSLPRAGVVAANESETHEAGEVQEEEEPLYLNWRGDRYRTPRFSAGRVLSDSTQSWWKNAAAPIMSGRVTLVGGTFREARDTRQTPAGEMSGLEVMAHIIEAEMTGGGMAPFSHLGAIVLEVAGGFALAILNRRFHSTNRLRLAARGIAVLCIPVAGAWLLHRYSIYWVNLAPVLLGVLLHQWYARAHGVSEILKAADSGHA
ncbi:MAG TPA: CHASE2 domain-containing protein [Vicinamibacterales bacterium]